MQCEWTMSCVEVVRLAWEGPRMPGLWLAFMLWAGVHGGGLCDALPIKEVGQPRQGLGIQDLLSFGPCGKGAHCPWAPAQQPPSQQPWLLLFHLMTAHRSSGSLGSMGASSHPPDMVDSAVFDLRVPELYRQSSAYHQIN